MNDRDLTAYVVTVPRINAEKAAHILVSAATSLSRPRPCRADAAQSNSSTRGKSASRTRTSSTPTLALPPSSLVRPTAPRSVSGTLFVRRALRVPCSPGRPGVPAGLPQEHWALRVHPRPQGCAERVARPRADHRPRSARLARASSRRSTTAALWPPTFLSLPPVCVLLMLAPHTELLRCRACAVCLGLPGASGARAHDCGNDRSCQVLRRWR